MSDFLTQWDCTGNRGDWALNGAVMATEPDIVAAVKTSVLTWGRARPDDLVDGMPLLTNRGWWGDQFIKRRLGSRIWLGLLGPHTPAQLQFCLDALKECVQWLVNAGVALKVATSGELRPNGAVALRLEVVEPSGVRTTFEFEYAWQGADLVSTCTNVIEVCE
jgi:phage gp46-like protein